MDKHRPPAPRTLAAALAIAIADGRALLDAPDRHYAFDARRWHGQGWQDARCVVCAAGAVMAQRLGAQRTDTLDASDFRDGWDWVLYAINAMRISDWASAMWKMRMRHRTARDGEDAPRDARSETSGEAAAGAAMYAQVRHCGPHPEELDDQFARAVEDAIERAPIGLARAWLTASEFRDAGGYRWFLDLAREHILPIVERCERETLAHARSAGA